MTADEQLNTFCLWSFFCSAVRATRASRASLTSWDSLLSGGDSGESESFSLSSFLRLSFFLSACHLRLCLLRSCSQLGRKHVNIPQIKTREDSWFYRRASALGPVILTFEMKRRRFRKNRSED